MSTDSKQKNDQKTSSEGSIDHRSNSSETSELNHSISPTTSPKITPRPPSPITRHREPKILMHKRRARSNSPRKTFSYLPPDRLNLRQWKQQRRLITKQEHDDRIYQENRQKLERLAKIAREPSSYPAISLEQERQRERHAYDYRRKLLKSYIPILENNLCIVDRLANVKGVYDRRKMQEDYLRHEQILKQDANNRKKSRETVAQRPFILPKINSKS